jgi:hypothetical protein
MAYRWTFEDVERVQKRNGVTTWEVPPGAPSTKSTRPPKYRNVKTTSADGIVHDAKGECERWEELKLMERAGEIRHLRRQVPFALVVSGILVCTYVADFVYEDGAATIVEDHKSEPTRELAAYVIKRKLMQALHGLQIREV